MSAMPISEKRMSVKSLIVLMWSFCDSKSRKVESMCKVVVEPGPPFYKEMAFESSRVSESRLGARSLERVSLSKIDGGRVTRLCDVNSTWES